MIDYDGLETAISILQNAGFVLFVVSVAVMIVSVFTGWNCMGLQTWQLLLVVIASALVTHYAGEIRVKIWMEEIKKS